MGKNEENKLEEIIPPLIDNRVKESEQNLDRFTHYKKTMDIIIKEISNVIELNRVRICTGFFSPHVWKLVGDVFNTMPISETEPVFQLLIGSEPKGQSNLEFQQWFNEQLHKELEDLDLSIELQNHIKSLIKFLERNDVRVALQNSPFVHGKLYHLLKVAIVGSSNFTTAGLTQNTELNIPVYDQKQLMALAFWFDTQFKRADLSYKQKLIDALKNCKLGTREWSPYDVYMKMLYESLKPTLSFEEEKSEIQYQLTVYQQEGVHRIIKAIDDFGGAMLADSVGLGKSPQALEVIRHLQANKQKREALIICPAQLSRNWEKMKNSADIWAQVFTMETLPRHLPEKKNFDIIVIDESHNFRNEKSKRYKQLELLLTKNPNAVVLLLTATPINTSMMDLYSQMMIITKSSPTYSPFYNIGVFDLKDYFKGVESRKEDIGKLRDHIIISRSRREIKLRQKLFGIDLTLGGQPLRFPERNLDIIEYMITDPTLSNMTSTQFYQDVIDLFDKLKFPYYNLERYNVSEKDEGIAQLGENLCAIMKILLLKRLESSLYAFQKSIKTQLTLSSLFENSVKKGIFIKPSKIWKIKDEVEADLEEGDDLLSNFGNFLESPESMKKYKEKNEDEISYDLTEIIKDINHDREVINKIQDLLIKIKNHKDQKLEAFLHTIEDLKDKKILVFSYFKDTTDYVYEELLKRFPENREKYAKITGDTLDGNKEDEGRNWLVLHFAPKSNCENDDYKDCFNPLKEKQLLICTDVLSEGQNLQDASVCINYDLHWNPVRIIQRIGRIDRLKSPNQEITVYNCFPEEGLETLLGLVSRLVERLKMINQTLELDGAVLTGEEITRKKEQIERLKDSDPTVLDELESEAELFGNDKARELLIKEIFKKGDNYFKQIPIGVHTGMISKENSGVAVVIRAYKKGVPSIFWGFEPDQPEKYEDWLFNGLVKSPSIVQNIIACEPSEARYLPDNENLNGQLFERVLKISLKLRELLSASDITQKLEDKLPQGNKEYLEYIKKAESLGRKMPLKFPDVSHIRKFLQLRRIDIIAKELEDLPKWYKEKIVLFKQNKKATTLKEKALAEDAFVKNTIEFIEKLERYITEQNLLGEKSNSQTDPTTKFELLGFLRVYSINNK